MKIIFKKILFLLIFFIIFFLISEKTNIRLESEKTNILTIPNPPNIIYPIQDYANVLSIEQIKNLNKKLILYSNSTSTEILVILVDSLYKNDPKIIAQEWGEKWKIGGSKNNGIVILISVKDRKISIQNGYGIEPYLTDFSTKEILNESKSFLEKGYYYKFIDYCTTKIYKKLGNNFNKKKILKQKNNIILIVISIILFFVILFFFPKILGINSPLINTLFMMNLLLRNNKNISDQNHYHYESNDEDDFDGFGNGGTFGGGGSDDIW